MLFQDGKIPVENACKNLIGLAREGTGGLDLSDTVRDGAKVLLLDEKLRRQLLLALTEGQQACTLRVNQFCTGQVFQVDSKGQWSFAVLETTQKCSAEIAPNSDPASYFKSRC